VNQEHFPFSPTPGIGRLDLGDAIPPATLGEIAGLLAKSCRRCGCASRLPAGSSPWVCRPTRTRHDDPLVNPARSAVDPSLRRSRAGVARRARAVDCCQATCWPASSRATLSANTNRRRGVAGLLLEDEAAACLLVNALARPAKKVRRCCGCCRRCSRPTRAPTRHGLGLALLFQLPGEESTLCRSGKALNDLARLARREPLADPPPLVFAGGPATATHRTPRPPLRLCRPALLPRTPCQPPGRRLAAAAILLLALSARRPAP